MDWFRSGRWSFPGHKFVRTTKGGRRGWRRDLTVAYPRAPFTPPRLGQTRGQESYGGNRNNHRGLPQWGACSQCWPIGSMDFPRGRANTSKHRVVPYFFFLLFFFSSFSSSSRGGSFFVSSFLLLHCVSLEGRKHWQLFHSWTRVQLEIYLTGDG